MRGSGHRTLSTLLRYLIIDLDDLRRAGKKASDYQGPEAIVRRLRAVDDEQRRIVTLRPHQFTERRAVW
jgi:hypothetical protein